MANFDWKTDEDLGWDDVQSPQPPHDKRHLWRWSLPLVLLALLGVAGWIVYGQLQERIEAATGQTDQDVRASFELVWESAESGDIELFNALLSGRDREWTSAQQQIAGGAGLLDRSPFGLELLSPFPEIEDLTLAPDLYAAHITATVPFATQIGNGLTETVTLQLPTTFRRGESRWLYAPPEDEYWGELEQWDTLFFQTTFYERDTEIVRRIHNDLDTLLRNWCNNEPENNCERLKTSKVLITFTNEPQIFTKLQQRPLPAERSEVTGITLPTPSLVGLPKDDAGYRALYAGYADYILTPIMAKLADYECCEHIAYWRALADWQLAEWGIKAWPLTVDDYETLLDGNIIINNRANLGWQWDDWEFTSPDGLRAAYAIVEFVMTFGNTDTPLQMQSKLGGNSQRLTGWLRQVIDSTSTVTNEFDVANISSENPLPTITRRLKMTLVEHTYTPAPPPIPLPDQDIATLCEVEETTKLMRYQMATDSWETLHESERFVPDFGGPSVALTALPDYSIWVRPNLFLPDDEEAPTPYIWHAGAIIPVEPPPGVNIYGSAFNDPLREQMLIYGSSTIESTFNQYEINIEHCINGNCSPQPVEGFPIWSPDGQHYTKFNNDTIVYTVHQRDGTVVNTLDVTDLRAPRIYWLDDQQFVLPNDDGDLLVYHVGSDEAQVWVEGRDFFDILPDGTQYIDYSGAIFFNPDNPAQMLLNVANPTSSRDSERSVVLAFDQETKSAELLPPLNGAFSVWNQSHPQYAMFVGGEEDSQTFRNNWPNRLFLVDMTTMEIADYPLFDNGFFESPRWSADNNWLLMRDAGYLRLELPSEDYAHLIFPPFNNCESPIWLTE